MTGKRILYAEDDFLNGKLCEILLKRAGVGCDLAFDGTSAVRMFVSGEYHAVVVDAYLPGLSGEEVARRIRKRDDDVPLVAVTSDLDATERLIEAGFDRVFEKPLRGREFLDYLLSRL